MFAFPKIFSPRCCSALVAPFVRQQYARRSVSPAALAFFSSSSSNTTSLVINAVGKDRTGIVSDITGFVIHSGGNVGESQAAKLGKHFSLMMQVELPSNQLEDLKTQLSNLKDLNAAFFETNLDEEDARAACTPSIGYSGHFSLHGADNPGIVHKITSALARNRLSIDKLITSTEIAPHGGTVLFTMEGTATTPAPLGNGFDIKAIKAELRDLGDSLNCDVVMEDDIDESGSGSFFGG